MKDIKVGRKFRIKYLGEGGRCCFRKDRHDNDSIYTIANVVICNAKVIVVSDFIVDGVAAAFPVEMFLSDDYNATEYGFLAELIK